MVQKACCGPAFVWACAIVFQNPFSKDREAAVSKRSSLRDTSARHHPRCPSARAFSEIFTVTADNELGPKLEPTMINELKRLIVLPVAFALFLCAAQASVGISWRGAPVVTAGIIR
jgi:hypothetical protein